MRDAPWRAVRQLVAAGTTGALFLLTGRHGADITAALMYHSIGVDLPWAVPTAIFRKQMVYLKKHFRFVTFGQLRAECQRPGGAGRVISVSLDDGRLDNYIHALPVLEEVGVKATFFAITGSIGGIFNASSYQVPMMDERQLREIASLGHEVGAHTVTHTALTRLPRSVAYPEMESSKRRLEDVLGIPVQSLAYPYGEQNREIRGWAAEIGFKCAGTARHALVTPQSDWLQIPRVTINQTLGSGLKFRSQASHAMEIYERLRGRSPRPDEY